MATKTLEKTLIQIQSNMAPCYANEICYYSKVILDAEKLNHPDFGLIIAGNPCYNSCDKHGLLNNGYRCSHYKK